MKQVFFLAIDLVLLIIPVWTQKSVPTDKERITKQATMYKSANVDLLSEEFSFLLQDFQMNHQSEINNFNIKIRVRYESGILESKYPDFRAIAKDIARLFCN